MVRIMELLNELAKKVNTKLAAMTGATASANGKAGLVPAPSKGDQGKFLRGDGSWGTPANTTYGAMKGASASAAGMSGLVPAPAKGKQGAFLRGDGTWAATVISASVTIPTTGWKSDSTANYPYYYDIPCSGLTAADKAVVMITQTSAAAAKACGMCSRTETRSGVIRIRARKVPASAVSAEYWIFGG